MLLNLYIFYAANERTTFGLRFATGTIRSGSLAAQNQLAGRSSNAYSIAAACSGTTSTLEVI